MNHLIQCYNGTPARCECKDEKPKSYRCECGWEGTKHGLAVHKSIKHKL